MSEYDIADCDNCGDEIDPLNYAVINGKLYCKKCYEIRKLGDK